jgi:glycosyltransferase involved in cell wall biosynthesis
MRIVLANWARVSEGASSGGGVNGYAQQLALELAARGHEVSWLSSGWAYIPDPATGLPAPCKVRRMEDFRGIRVFEVINSPVVSPGIFQHREPKGELSAPALEAELARFFQLLEPDVVHFHNIEGFTTVAVDGARQGGGKWGGARTVFSLHNYYTVCPQVYLMKGGRIACQDFEGGRACEGCVEGPDPEFERQERARFHMKDFPRPAPAPGVASRLVQVVSPPKPPPIPGPAYPGRPVEAFADLVPDRAGSGNGVGSRPSAAAMRAETTPQERVPLSNEVRVDPSDASIVNGFGERRREMVTMLSRCDRVLAVSEFVRRKFESLGVDPRAIRAMPIGSRMTQLAAAWPQLRDEPEPFDGGRAVRAVFMGYHNYYKGLPMLLDSLELIAPADLKRLHLYVFAKDVELIAPRLERLRPSLGGLTIRGGYEYDQVPMLLAGKDLGLVPSVWWDNGPQTVMEFFSCGLPVLGAELGGIPDLVNNGVNGLLHRGNDRAHLAEVLTGVLRNPGRLLELRRKVRPPLSMPEHASAMEVVYNECLKARKG